MITHSIIETVYALLGLFIFLVAYYSGYHSRTFVFLRYYGVVLFFLTAIHVAASDLAVTDIGYWSASSWLLLRTVSPIIIIFLLNGFTITSIQVGLLCFGVALATIVMPMFGFFYTGNVISRPLEFVPIFLNLYLLWRVHRTRPPQYLQKSVVVFAILNVISHLIIIFSQVVYDTPFLWAHIVQVLSLLPFFIYFKYKKDAVEQKEIADILKLTSDGL